MRPAFTGVILAGGESSRFGGRCKAMLRTPSGPSWACRACVELYAAGASSVLLSCRPGGSPILEGVQGICDLFPGKGPLGGMATVALTLCGSTPFVFLPCDMPALNRSHVTRLFEELRHSGGSYLACRSPEGFFAQPVCAALPGTAGAMLLNALSMGHLSLWRLWMDLGFTPVSSEGPLVNVNSPADLSGTVFGADVPAC